jgi:hypothetical protein
VNKVVGIRINFRQFQWPAEANNRPTRVYEERPLAFQRSVGIVMVDIVSVSRILLSLNRQGYPTRRTEFAVGELSVVPASRNGSPPLPPQNSVLRV